MVASPPKSRPGRPRKFPGGNSTCVVRIPDDLREAAERNQVLRKLSTFSDAVRELLRTGAESRKLIDPRE